MHKDSNPHFIDSVLILLKQHMQTGLSCSFSRWYEFYYCCHFLLYRTVCKTLDVSPSSTSTQENADLKFQRGGSKWHQLSYTYNINLNLWLPKNKPSQSLYKTIIVRLEWCIPVVCAKPWFLTRCIFYLRCCCWCLISLFACNDVHDYFTAFHVIIITTMSHK